MKRIFSINLSNYGSTGSIAYGIKLVAEKEGYTVCCAYPGNAKNKRVNNDDYIICSDFFGGSTIVLPFTAACKDALPQLQHVDC